MQTKLKLPHFFYVIMSMALLLFLSGCLALGWLYLQDVMQNLRERVSMLVELQDEANPDRVQALRLQLSQTKGIQKESIAMLSKEEALQQMQADLGADFLDTTLQNPLRNALTMYLQPNYLHEDSMALLRYAIRQDSIVADVYMQAPGFDNIGNNVKQIALVSGVMIFLFLVISVVLIHNTIRLSLYANRFLIKNMELVGATWGFIGRPYLVRGVWNGVISGLIATLGLLALSVWLPSTLPENGKIPLDWQRPALVGLAVMSTGILLSLASTWMVVTRFLRMRLDDLY